VDEVGAPRLQRGQKSIRDGLQLDDHRLDLGKPDGYAVWQPWIGPASRLLPSCLQQLGYLRERKPQSLRRLDRAQCRGRLSRVKPVSARGPGRLCKQTAALVVAQGLPVNPRGSS
jgi:hypothetical protein